MPKPFLILIILLIIPFCNLNAQNNAQCISGKIIDAKSKKALQNVEVFVSGTTIGTTTNAKGEFTLNSPLLPCHLGVMHLSYQPKVLVITNTESLKIELSKKVRSIHEVKIKAKDRRKANLRMFKKYFLYYASKSRVKILNDSVLRFKKDEYDFHAYCNSPLIVENKQLGYQIKVLIKDFHVCKKDKIGGKKIDLNEFTDNAMFKLQAYYYYQDIPTKSSIKEVLIKNNRRKHYYGSLRHFLTCLYANDLETNGYALQTVPNSNTEAIVLCNTEENIKRFKFSTDKVKITYFEDFENRPVNIKETSETYYIWPTTFISLGKEFDVYPNGTSNNLNFEIHGAMGQRSLANSLPSNYIPESKPEFNF